MRKIIVIPEPKRLDFTGRWFDFDGFEGLPEFLKREFDIPKGRWKITKDDRKGTGIDVKDKEITIWGNEAANYATVLQLIRQRKGRMPEVKVEERPKFQFRGYHLDIARGGVPKVETFKRILRWLFLLKYNIFAIYFEDLFPWPKYPEIGRHRGRLTEGGLKEVIEYGKNLGIEVFPSLELSGHMEHILSLPEFRGFSEWHNPAEGCLDLSDEKAREFAYDLLNEVIDFFPSRYIHIGGDETWALGRGKSLSRTWQFEGPKLYELHHRKMVEIIKERGKYPIFWGDMISGMYLGEDRLKWAEVIDSNIWRQVIVANWDYSPSSKQYFREKILIFKERNLQQIVCPGLSNWSRYYPNFRVAVGNLTNFLTTAKEEEIPSFLVTAWGDDGEECLFSFLEPLLLAAMEIAEGDGEWQEKWMAMSGESEGVLKARIIFGEPDISETLKHIIFKDAWYRRLSPERMESLRCFWKKCLNELEDVHLPPDLDFIRCLLQIAVKVLRNEATVSDYLMLSSRYSKLWLKERKTEGLGRIIERFWGAAGKEDMNAE